MATIIRLRQGLASALPTSGLNIGEALITSDRLNAFFSISATEAKTLTPAIETLPELLGADVANATDFLIIHDASETTGSKEKRISVAEFKATFAAASDEKVAVAFGGTPGYIYGTNGADGIIRLGDGLSWTKDAFDNFVTISVDDIDGGTF